MTFNWKYSVFTVHLYYENIHLKWMICFVNIAVDLILNVTMEYVLMYSGRIYEYTVKYLALSFSLYIYFSLHI